jgi:hypothetical protein
VGDDKIFALFHELAKTKAPALARRQSAVFLQFGFEKMVGDDWRLDRLSSYRPPGS